MTLFLALADACRGRMAMFKPSELAFLLWAFARLHFKCPGGCAWTLGNSDLALWFGSVSKLV